MNVTASESREDDDFLLDLGRSLLSAVVVPVDYNERPTTFLSPTATSTATTFKDSLSVDTSTTSHSSTSFPLVGEHVKSSYPTVAQSVYSGRAGGCPLSMMESPMDLSFDALKAVEGAVESSAVLAGLRVSHDLAKRSPRARSVGRSPSARVKKGDNPPRGVWRNRGGYIAAIYVDRERVYAPLRKTVQDAVRDRAALEQARLVYTTKDSLKRFVNTVLRNDHSHALQVAELAGIPVHVPEELTSDTVMHASAEEEREAELDQYADKGVEASDESEAEVGVNSVDDEASMIARAKWVPIRLTYDERKLLRLVESAMQVADYTDKVDVQFPPHVSPARQMAIRARQMCAILNGLVVAEDYSKGAALVKSRDYAAYGNFYRKAFEISRRYKLLNPERMRSTYGKLIYFLMDTVRPDTVGLFEHIGVIEPVKTVHSTLQASPRALKMLNDPLLEVATREIYSEGRSRGEVQRDIRAKESAIRKLSRKYCAKGTRTKKNKGHFG
ncbi:hypothetical protein FOZ63_019102, partial [Perkinsus olseni]